jgi:hypothetical protein
MPRDSVGQGSAFAGITREMISAGIAELFSYDQDRDDPDQVVLRIYRAMKNQCPERRENS